jgi:hypothetical protein
MQSEEYEAKVITVLVDIEKHQCHGIELARIKGTEIIQTA